MSKRGGHNELAARAQEAYCDGQEAPMFAPRDGICPACGRNIYEALTVEQAGTRLITGCPLCHYSFLE